MTILEKIRNLVFVSDTNEFAAMELEDGRMISISTESMDIGSKVAVILEDGNEEMLEAGAYVLSDGTAFTVDETGIVTEMTPVEAPAEEEIPVDAVEEGGAEAPAEVIESPEVVDAVAEIVDAVTPEEVTPEDSAMIAEEITALIAEEVAKVEQAMMAKFEEFKTLMIEMAESQEKFSKDFEAFKKSPSDKSISQTAFSKEGDTDELTSRIERLKALRKTQK